MIFKHYIYILKTMTECNFFPYAWHIDKQQTEVTLIRAYGLNKINENVCVRITGFTPYLYVELPDNIMWNDNLAQRVCNVIDEKMGEKRPLKKELKLMKRLYYANYNQEKKKYKKFPYLFLAFSSDDDRTLLQKILRYGFYIPGLGKQDFKVHEANADPILQLCSRQDIPTAGWIKFNAKEIKNSKQSLCHREYSIKWNYLKPAPEILVVPRPLIMSFDIEVNSTNINAMPKANKPGDKVFQISCVLSRQGDDEKKYKKYLLTLGNPDQKITGKDVIIQTYKTESALLLGYKNFIQTHNPNIIAGYNILGFDIEYMLERAKHNLCIADFDQQGFIPEQHAKEIPIKWSSSAYKNQEFLFLDAEGRLFVDLLPLVKRDYKMDNYKLKTISDFFLGETKDPLSAKGIFKCYRDGMKKTKDGKFTKYGCRAMAVVGKYCVQDSVLVSKLIETLQTWIGLTEMAKICNVPIFALYTQGQQIKVFSQVYKICMKKRYIVEKDGYVAAEDEHYQGAYVFEPIPGVYEKVIPFDFASLYPNTIIANNICWSTLVVDERIPDKLCNVIEWEDHQGCCHDTKKRSTPVKHYMCAKRKYRFLKEPIGILPGMLKYLLDTRKSTRKEIKKLKKRLETEELSKDAKEFIETQITVLDKRQLSYKVSANSAYGALGVQRGRLPFMPGAMSTTAKGREAVHLAAKTIVNEHKGELIYGDTDSCYIRFPHLDNNPAKDIWDYSEHVANQVTKLYDEPMKLEFEEVIYWNFLILTKKRYMSLPCGKDGIVSKKISKKGVLLARRDNSRYVRECYSDIIMKIFYREQRKNIEMAVLEHIEKLFTRQIQNKWFIITKSLGDVGNFTYSKNSSQYLQNKQVEYIKYKGEFKKDSKGNNDTRWTANIGDYKITMLHPKDEKKREKQKLTKGTQDEKTFYLRSLPAQVQLAEKIRRRGKRIDPGTRMEYVLTTDNTYYTTHKAKQWEKMEDMEYFMEHSDILRIDFMYYLKNLSTPLDQVLGIVNEDMKKFTEQQYKLRVQKIKCMESIKKLSRPKLIIEN